MSRGMSTLFDPVTSVMLLLVAGLGAVVMRYSHTALRGDPGRARYLLWLSATLAAVLVLVLAKDLVVFALAWTGTSLTLHQLLTFYSGRRAAQVAAHKKFLVSRLADLCLWSGIALVWSAAGTTRFDGLAAWAEHTSSLPLAVQAAAVLWVVAAALKCAQLPFHGWLTQVMEAPTPVSALLHAGVVNLGGLMMIRLAPVMAKAPFAQLLLVAIGTVTACVAALVMTTRVSIKVALAWSTIAQMGFMLVQCGLGAWDLALLHLVAHSLYKAHAFLRSGSAVERWKEATFTGNAQRQTPALALAAAAVVLPLFVAAALSGHARAPHLVLALGVLMPFASGHLLLVRLVAVAGLTFTWHALAARWLPVPALAAPAQLGGFVAGAGFAVLFALQAALLLRPRGAFARWLHPRLFAGLYLDERFTRLTFRLWPPRLPHGPAAPPLSLPTSQEA